MPAHTLDFDAILFDMVRCSLSSFALDLARAAEPVWTPLTHLDQDGTLINSTPAVNANWKQFAEK